MQDKRFQVSGLNSRFEQSHLPFNHYVQYTKQLIRATRTDLNQRNRELVVDANAAFELRPDDPEQCKRGALLVHGLLDSPYTLRTIAKHLHAQGFWVRSLLLPGHGTVPGDLLEVQYQDWLAATRYGIQSFADRVESLYYVGYSTGAALGLYHALEQQPLAGLILFAPVIKIKNPLARFSQWHRRWRWLGKRSQWFVQTQDNDYCRYESITFNAIHQVYQLTRELAAKQQQLAMPVLMISTANDEVVSHRAIVRFMQQQSSAQNRFIIYGNNLKTTDPQVTLRSSCYSAENIIDFSHLALLIPPEDPHYGRHGDYHDVRHYRGIGKCLAKSPQSTRYAGAITLGNLRQHYMQRLTYNPDYAYLLQSIDEFIK
jgi:alpha-beta hydrolase superfamily lysophospholipase